MEIKKIEPQGYHPIQITLQSPTEENYFKGIFKPDSSDLPSDYRAWGNELLARIDDLRKK